MSVFSKIVGPPSRDRFANKLTRALRQCGIADDIVYDREKFALQVGEPGEKLINLGNIYAEHCAIPRRLRKAHLETLAEAQAGFTEYPDDFVSAKHHIMPRLRTAAHQDLITLQLKAMDAVHGELRTVIKPINSVWSAEVVFDSPRAVGSVDPERLELWGINQEKALKVALDNLWKITTRDLQQVHPGLYMSTWEDSYDASRLLLDTFIWRHTVKGDQVVFCPIDDVMIVTGSRDPDNLVRASQMVEELMSSSTRPLTGIAVCRDGETWKPFMPEPSSPAHQSMKRLASLSAAAEYNEQKQLLELMAQQHADKGDVSDLDPAFPATYAVAKDTKGTGWVSYAVWGDVETLLPVTDRIAFIRSDTDTGVLGMVEWERAVEVCGHLMEETDYSPKRFRVSEFPTPDLMAKLDLE